MVLVNARDLHDHLKNEKYEVCLGCKKPKPLIEREGDRRLQRDHCATCINTISETCPACRESRPLSEFYYTFSRIGRRAIYSREKYCCKCYWRASDASTTYQISISRYLKTLEEQGGVCAVCSRGPAAGLVVDHCHKTGRFRGLLCRTCNSGLGFFYDNPTLLRAAAGYAEQHST
jgi:hypothetical protein